MCVPLALGGLGVSLWATHRVQVLSVELEELGVAGRAEGSSFVETLRGEHAERQRVAYDRRRAIALALAGARRDRLLGVLLAGAAVLAGGALSVMSRIAAEIEEDRRHLRGQGVERGPGRS